MQIQNPKNEIELEIRNKKDPKKKLQKDRTNPTLIDK